MGWGRPATRGVSQLITVRTGAGEHPGADPGRTVLGQMFRAEKGRGAVT